MVAPPVPQPAYHRITRVSALPKVGPRAPHPIVVSGGARYGSVPPVARRRPPGKLPSLSPSPQHGASVVALRGTIEELRGSVDDLRGVVVADLTLGSFGRFVESLPTPPSGNASMSSRKLPPLDTPKKQQQGDLWQQVGHQPFTFDELYLGARQRATKRRKNQHTRLAPLGGASTEDPTRDGRQPPPPATELAPPPPQEGEQPPPPPPPSGQPQPPQEGEQEQPQLQQVKSGSHSTMLPALPGAPWNPLRELAVLRESTDTPPPPPPPLPPSGDGDAAQPQPPRGDSPATTAAPKRRLRVGPVEEILLDEEGVDPATIETPKIATNINRRRSNADHKVSKERLRVVYQRFTPPGESEIHVDQLPEILTHLGYIMVSPEVVQEIIEEVTKYSSLSLQEFQESVERFAAVERERFREQFQNADDDNSGTLSVEELGKLLQSIGITPLRATLQEAIEEVDEDRSGLVDFGEFVHLMAVYRVTEGFTRAEVAYLRRIFTRFAEEATSPEGEPLVKTAQLGQALMHIFGPQAGDMAKEIGKKLESIVGGAGRAAGSRPSSSSGPSGLTSVANAPHHHHHHHHGGGGGGSHHRDQGLGFQEFLIWARRLREMEIEEYKRQFQKFDPDGSGTIDVSELQALVRSIGYRPLRAMLMDVLRQCDANNDGTLDFEEFLHLMHLFRSTDGFSRAEVTELSEVFHIFANNELGELSILDLMKMLRYQGYVTNLQDLQKMFREVDFNHSNSIDLRELMRLMRKHREEELSQIQMVFDRHVLDEESGKLPANALKYFLKQLGYRLKEEELQSLITVEAKGAELLDYDECVGLVDRSRYLNIAARRRVAGYSDDEVRILEDAFEGFDEDHNGLIERNELARLLEELHIPMHTADDQRIFLKKVDHARANALEAGVLPEELGQDGFSITKATLVHLMRVIHNENDCEQVEEEGRAMRESKFIPQEVNEFRSIFDSWSEASGRTGLPSAQRPCDDSPASTPRASSLGIESRSVSLERFLTREGVLRVLRTLGLNITITHRADLDAKIASYRTPIPGHLDFPNFLRLMRWMLDHNFAGIAKIAGVA